MSANHVPDGPANSENSAHNSLCLNALTNLRHFTLHFARNPFNRAPLPWAAIYDILATLPSSSSFSSSLETLSLWLPLRDDHHRPFLNWTVLRNIVMGFHGLQRLTLVDQDVFASELKGMEGRIRERLGIYEGEMPALVLRAG